MKENSKILIIVGSVLLLAALIVAAFFMFQKSAENITDEKQRDIEGIPDATFWGSGDEEDPEPAAPSAQNPTGAPAETTVETTVETTLTGQTVIVTVPPETSPAPVPTAAPVQTLPLETASATEMPEQTDPLTVEEEDTSIKFGKLF